jgi:hypothetical protein
VLKFKGHFIIIYIRDLRGHPGRLKKCRKEEGA